MSLQHLTPFQEKDSGLGDGTPKLGMSTARHGMLQVLQSSRCIKRFGIV
jgi:hypothetical protein